MHLRNENIKGTIIRLTTTKAKGGARSHVSGRVWHDTNKPGTFPNESQTMFMGLGTCLLGARDKGCLEDNNRSSLSYSTSVGVRVVSINDIQVSRIVLIVPCSAVAYPQADHRLSPEIAATGREGRPGRPLDSPPTGC